MNDDFAVWFFIGALVFVCVLLVSRELVTWYWKINQGLETLKRIDNNLEYIARLLETQNPDIAKKVHDTKEDSTIN